MARAGKRSGDFEQALPPRQRWNRQYGDLLGISLMIHHQPSIFCKRSQLQIPPVLTWLLLPRCKAKPRSKQSLRPSHILLLMSDFQHPTVRSLWSQTDSTDVQALLSAFSRALSKSCSFNHLGFHPEDEPGCTQRSSAALQSHMPRKNKLLSSLTRHFENEWSWGNPQPLQALE